MRLRRFMGVKMKKSTSYKCVSAETRRVVFAGSKKQMHALAKKLNAHTGSQRYFVSLSMKKVGETWGSK